MNDDIPVLYTLPQGVCENGTARAVLCCLVHGRVAKEVDELCSRSTWLLGFGSMPLPRDGQARKNAGGASKDLRSRPFV